MAIRVRKLARELGQSAGEVLGLLHHLGYDHYKRPDDMVADAPAAKVRSAAKAGVRAERVPVPVAAKPAERHKRPRVAADDVMGQLLEGVVPVVRDEAPVRPRASPVPPPRPSVVEPPAASSEAPRLRQEIAQLRSELTTLREQLAEQDGALAAARDAQGALEVLQGIPPEGVGVGDLIHARGLRGADEARRALLALLSAHQGVSLLAGRLSEADAARLRHELDALVLLDGTAPSELATPAVSVSSDRAEAPGAESLDRWVRPLGEQLLLNGLRHMRLAGVPTRWHVPIRARIDRRVAMDFVPGGPWDASRLSEALEGADVVGATGVSLDGHAREALQASGVRWVEAAGGVLPLLQALVHHLQG